MDLKKETEQGNETNNISATPPYTRTNIAARKNNYF